MNLNEIRIRLRDIAPVYDIGAHTAGDESLHQHSENFQFSDFVNGIREVLMVINAPNRTNQKWVTLFESLSRTVDATDMFTENFELGYLVPFVEDSTYGNPDAVKGTNFNWSMRMKSYQTKVWDISGVDIKKLRKTFTDAERRLASTFEYRLKQVLNEYLKTFIPAIYKKALFEVPAVGGDYSSNFGLLHNTSVPAGMLIEVDPTAPAGSPLNVVRNHYVQIANPVNEINPQDLMAIKEYMHSYSDMENETVYAIMHENDIRQLETFFKDPIRLDNLLESGIPSKIFSGINIMEADTLIPKGFAFFFTASKMKPLFTKLQHTSPEYRGIYFDWEGPETFTWESVKATNLPELRLLIGDTNVYLTGRHRGLWVDTLHRTSISQTIGTLGTLVDMHSTVKDILNKKSVFEKAKLNYKEGM